MWLIFNLKEEFRKIKESFKKRDKEITTNYQSIDKLKEDLNNNSLKIARIEGVISILLNKSQSQVSRSPKQSQNKIETQVIKRLRKNKKEIVIAEIEKLSDSMSVMSMYNVIVLERGLCSKASFYRYISSLNSLKVKETETELRQEIER